MARIIEFDVIDTFQFHGSQKIACVVKAKDLLPFIKGWNIDEWMLPLNGNVRRPTKNKIHDGIVKSISQGLKEISSPITIAASRYREFLVNPTKQARIELTFNTSETAIYEEYDGVLDGGHRLLGCRTAEIRGIDNVFSLLLHLNIYIGLTPDQIKEKAVELNTSEKVTVTSLAHYQGHYDWIKPHLVDYQIQYYSGQRGVPDDTFCKVSRIYSLILLLNKNYSPFDLDSKKRHPLFVANTGDVSARKDFQEIVQRYQHLIHDVIFLQTLIAATLERLAQQKNISWVTKPKEINKCTHLPTGEILNVKLPSRVLTHPIISSFRLLLNDDLQWKCNDIKETSEKIIPALVRRYCDLLKQQRFLGRSADSVAVDPFVWDCLCQTLTKESQRLGITLATSEISA